VVDAMTSEGAGRILIGIGNPHRGDDAAGRVVARLLRDALAEDVKVVEHDGEATGLLALLDGAASAFLVDACVSGAPAGTVRRLDIGLAPLPRGAFGLSTHGLGLAVAIELGRTLGQLPPSCVIYAIEGCAFESGAPLSPPVATAVADVARQLRAEIVGKEVSAD